MNRNRNVVLFVLAGAGAFVWICNTIPQIKSANVERTAKIGETPEQLVAVGKQIFGAQCLTCHSVGEDPKARCPNQAGLGERASKRRPGLGGAGYLVESVYDPNAFVVPGYPKNQMRPVNQPPIALAHDEILAVLAYLNALGGTTDPAFVEELKQAQEPWRKGLLRPGRDHADRELPLPILAGDRARGLTLFDKSCKVCHRIDSGGADTCPDLRAIGASQSPEYILESILDPNAVIVKGYDLWGIWTADGDQYDGVLKNLGEVETFEAEVVRGGKKQVLTFARPRRDLTVLVRNEYNEVEEVLIPMSSLAGAEDPRNPDHPIIMRRTQSMMPGNFAQVFTPQEVYDLVALLILGGVSARADDLASGKKIYGARCVWCHGESGRGDGRSAESMYPRPRDFVAAEYRIRSTPHGRLPTDEDLVRIVARGIPDTPMPAWRGILTDDEIRAVVGYIRSFSPRFREESREPVGPPPAGPASVARGAKLFVEARCHHCHGREGHGDGPITATLNYEWGHPVRARDFTRGWTFKGGTDLTEIYRRITTGLNGTLMGPYADLLTDAERWDLAHYVASLNRESAAEDFVVTAARVEGPLPGDPDAPEWEGAKPVCVPLSGQVTLDPPYRWWAPTVGSVHARALWSGDEIAFRVEWNDPTDQGPVPDAAGLQFPARTGGGGGKPYFLLGSEEEPVRVWHWSAPDRAEERVARGPGRVDPVAGSLSCSSSFREGRRRVVFRRRLAPADAVVPDVTFRSGEFVPVLFSVQDGAAMERGNRRALSTWMYVRLDPPPSRRPTYAAACAALGALVALLAVAQGVRR